MHTIYQTEAFILASRPVSETNMHFHILTRELGMIEASAQGLRTLKSKLRFSLCDMSYSDIALVYGKGGWKITSAMEKENLYKIFRDEKDGVQKVAMLGQVFSLLKRLLHGEEKNEELFAFIHKTAIFLKKHQDLTLEHIRNLECVLVLSILHLLGYVSGDSGVLVPYVVPESITTSLLEGVTKDRAHLLKEINRALKESQL